MANNEVNQVSLQLSAGAKYTTKIQARNHELIADEPESLDGLDQGPTPYELLLASLGSCTAITIRMYVDRKGWDVKGIDVQLKHEKIPELSDEGVPMPGKFIDVFERDIQITGDLEEKQYARILTIADKCPVHKTLHSAVEIKTRLV